MCSSKPHGYNSMKYAKLFCGNIYRYAGLFGNANGIDIVLVTVQKIVIITRGP